MSWLSLIKVNAHLLTRKRLVEVKKEFYLGILEAPVNIYCQGDEKIKYMKKQWNGTLKILRNSELKATTRRCSKFANLMPHLQCFYAMPEFYLNITFIYKDSFGARSERLVILFGLKQKFHFYLFIFFYTLYFSLAWQ